MKQSQHLHNSGSEVSPEGDYSPGVRGTFVSFGRKASLCIYLGGGVGQEILVPNMLYPGEQRYEPADQAGKRALGTGHTRLIPNPKPRPDVVKAY
jgi:hypothetical protein